MHCALAPVAARQSTRKGQDRVGLDQLTTILVLLTVSVHELDSARLGYVVVGGGLPFLNRTLSEVIQVSE